MEAPARAGHSSPEADRPLTGHPPQVGGQTTIHEETLQFPPYSLLFLSLLL